MSKWNDRSKNDFFENVARIIEQARRFVGRTAGLDYGGYALSA